MVVFRDKEGLQGVHWRWEKKGGGTDRQYREGCIAHQCARAPTFPAWRKGRSELSPPWQVHTWGLLRPVCRVPVGRSSVSWLRSRGATRAMSRPRFSLDASLHVSTWKRVLCWAAGLRPCASSPARGCRTDRRARRRHHGVPTRAPRAPGSRPVPGAYRPPARVRASLPAASSLDNGSFHGAPGSADVHQLESLAGGRGPAPSCRVRGSA